MATGLAGWAALAAALVAAPVLADDGCGARSASGAEGTRVAQLPDRPRDAVSDTMTDKAKEAAQEKAREAAKDRAMPGNAPATGPLPGGPVLPGTAGAPPSPAPSPGGSEAAPSAPGAGGTPSREAVPARDVPKPPSGY